MDKMNMYNLLIIDDEEQILDVMDRFFSLKGFNVKKAGNGRDGIEIFKRNSNIDLVILDEKMPGMSGTDFIKEVRKTRKDLPVVVLTGSIGLSKLEKVKKLYSKHVLYKPIRLSELTDLVSGILKSEKEG